MRCCCAVHLTRIVTGWSRSSTLRCTSVTLADLFHRREKWKSDRWHALAGGGRGAAIGAVSGAAVGTGAEVATRGQRVHIPPRPG